MALKPIPREKVARVFCLCLHPAQLLDRALCEHVANRWIISLLDSRGVMTDLISEEINEAWLSASFKTWLSASFKTW